MCGIVGYIGEQDAKGILLNGLEKLETLTISFN